MHDWKWLVIYDDGTDLVESDDVGFGMVEIDRVETLIVADFNDETRVYTIPIEDGMRPIFFRRKRNLTLLDPEHVPIEYIDKDGNLQTTITFATVFGWQKTVGGRNVKSLIWLMYDGSVAITDRDIDEL